MLVYNQHFEGTEVHSFFLLLLLLVPETAFTNWRSEFIHHFTLLSTTEAEVLIISSQIFNTDSYFFSIQLTKLLTKPFLAPSRLLLCRLGAQHARRLTTDYKASAVVKSSTAPVNRC